ncbi:ABC transporter ATP-binding protein/permease [Amedibacillus sp. YH-ame10]
MLQIKEIKKEYTTGSLVQTALAGVSLNLRDNEFVAILGPSGSGKTTLLNIIGGLDRYDEGDLIINGISTKKYKDHDWDSYRNHTIGFVFQSYNLIPHQSVLANVELALTISGISKSERRKRAKEALDQVGLGEQGHKKPNQMSGGQMQRVAIARALVNDPDIVLADEPTGALDSDTSIQVMKLLEEVAKDRLVVMVTHNPDLAEEYATRIVKLKDGTIRSDTNPYQLSEDDVDQPRHENMGKSSMSFLTSLVLSFNNLRTKKARTILTSFAGSIGIIGIALILSLSNGVSQYIKTIEEDTLSQYPLQIQSTGFDITSMMSDTLPKSNTTSKDGEVHVSQMITNMFSKIGSNDLVSLKEYLDQNKTDMKQNINSIEYSYAIAPQIYQNNTKDIRQVHPDKSFSSLGFGSSSESNSMMSMMMSTDVFYQMPSNPGLYESQYDIKAGEWPKNYNECVLVLTKNGNMNDLMLYTLGLRSYSELDQMIQQFSKEEAVKLPKMNQSYSYKDIVGTTFKLVNATEYYQYDESYQVYIDKTNDKNHMSTLIQNGEEIKIVGIVQPSGEASATMLKAGIAYPADLTTHVMKQSQDSTIVAKQLEQPSIDVFTGKEFNTSDDRSMDMTSLFSVDETMLKSAFSFDQSKIKLDVNSFDFADLSIDFDKLPAIDVNAIFEDLNLTMSQEQIEKMVRLIQADFQRYLTENDLQDPTKLTEYFALYFQSEEAQTLIQTEMIAFLKESGLSEQFQVNLEKQMQSLVNEFSTTIATTLKMQLASQMEKQMGVMLTQIQDAIRVDGTMFSKAIKMNMNEKELSELMMSLMMKETSTFDGNLKKLGYSNINKPNGISIYPKDFVSKQKVLDVLDKYNEDMKKVDEDKVISYTDYVGTLMSSVTDIIDVISYVLIAFVAISLVVSSIMIGVITYISVLERKKEIGILRAMGASKKNISQVFNAETFIIGLLAGILGIVVTLLLLIPGNMVIHEIAGNTLVNASLPIVGAIVLILLSVVLTLLGGLIPSKKASHEDPVTALRTE